LLTQLPKEKRVAPFSMQRDVLGTLMLGLLAGHRRYAHIAALRGDAVAAQVLCMDKRRQRRRLAPCAGTHRSYTPFGLATVNDGQEPRLFDDEVAVSTS